MGSLSPVVHFRNPGSRLFELVSIFYGGSSPCLPFLCGSVWDHCPPSHRFWAIPLCLIQVPWLAKGFAAGLR